MPELTYHIDKNLSFSNNCLILKIETAEREGPYLKIHDKTPQLLFNNLLKLSSPQDSLAIEAIKQEEFAYHKKQTGNTPSVSSHAFNTVHISSKQSNEVLKLLAATGKLYFNKNNLSVDFFSESIFYYQIDSTQTPKRAIGRLRNLDSDFAVRDCEFIGQGPSHWYIKGISLKFITSSVTWKELRRSYELENLFDDSKFTQELLEEDGPEKKYIGESLPLKTAEPLPLLRLGDRTGAFADLWITYGETNFLYQDPIQSKNAISRDPKAEKSWENDLLETDFIRKTVGKTHYYCSLDKVAKSLTFLLEIGWTIIDAQGNRVIRHSETHLQTEAQNQIILIKGSANYSEHSIDLKNIMGAFNRRERFLKLADGIVGLMPDTPEEINLGILQDVDITSAGLVLKKNRIGTLSEIWENKLNCQFDPITNKIATYLEKGKVETDYLPSTSFKGSLRPYQQEGLNWLSFLYENGFHGILADDMGLGKTVQVLALLSRLEISKGPVLIVMPTSLLYNWEKEIQRFIPTWNSIRHHGPTRAKKSCELNSKQIILTTYTTLRMDQELFKGLDLHCLILDEAQAIKNPNTQIAQTVYDLKAQFKLSITGTPVENHLLELWSHFRFLIPDLFGSQKEFAADISTGSSDYRYLQRIKKKIRPFILRRKKQEVAKDLPEKIEQTVWIEMEPEQKVIYEAFLSGVKRTVVQKVDQEGMGKHRMEVLEAILRLRQICCHPLLVSSKFEDQIEGLNKSAKFEQIFEDLETIVEEGRKVLVYSQFTALLQLAAREVKKRGWKFNYLDGSTVNREKIVEEFQHDPEIPIFLISLKAGGVGLNLTSADYVFIFDPWWNKSVEDQAIDRAHRIGRKEVVIAKRYICVHSIEEKIMKLKENKSQMIEELLDEGEINLGGLNDEDLRFLLS